MKNYKHTIIHYIVFGFIIILITLLPSCNKGLQTRGSGNDFTLDKAKKFHLEYSSDLRLPNSGNRVKSTLDYDEILVPLWHKATYHEIQFPSKLAKTFEIPLNTGAVIGGILLREKGTTYEKATMKSSLVIQEFSQGEKKTLRQMVVTLIGKDNEGKPNSEVFTYMGDHKNFTGFMIISALDGKIVNIFQYLNGHRSIVYLKHTKEAPDNTPLHGFSFVKSKATKSAYGNSEPGKCSVCGIESLVYITYMMCENCVFAWEEELDKIVVTPYPDICNNCGRIETECECGINPFACSICNMEPCQCDGPNWNCEYCDDPTCNGKCDNKSEGGDNENTTSKDNSEQLTAKISYSGDERCEKTVKPLIESLLKSNVVKRLINSLDTIKFVMNNNEKYPASYNPSNDEIIISSLFVNYDFTLLEELVHKLQHKNNNLFFKNEDYNNYLNLEIEAKIMILLYGEKYQTYDIAHFIGGETEQWLQLIKAYLENKTDANYQLIQNYFVDNCVAYDSKFKNHDKYRNIANIDDYILQLQNE